MKPRTKIVRLGTKFVFGTPRILRPIRNLPEGERFLECEISDWAVVRVGRRRFALQDCGLYWEAVEVVRKMGKYVLKR